MRVTSRERSRRELGQPREGHMKYILTSKELMDLAKEVAAATANADEDETVANVVKAVLTDNGIKWEVGDE